MLPFWKFIFNHNPTHSYCLLFLLLIFFLFLPNVLLIFFFSSSFFFSFFFFFSSSSSSASSSSSYSYSAAAASTSPSWTLSSSAIALRLIGSCNFRPWVSNTHYLQIYLDCIQTHNSRSCRIPLVHGTLTSCTGLAHAFYRGVPATSTFLLLSSLVFLVHYTQSMIRPYLHRVPFSWTDKEIILTVLLWKFRTIFYSFLVRDSLHWHRVARRYIVSYQSTLMSTHFSLPFRNSNQTVV
jgi:hypothetical protein